MQPGCLCGVVCACVCECVRAAIRCIYDMIRPFTKQAYYTVAAVFCCVYCCCVYISVLHPSRCLRARNLRKSAYSLVCFISCFPACFFFSLFPFWFWFRFRYRFFDVELFFFFILSFSCGYYAVLSVSVATCTAYRMYLIRTCADLTFIFVWGVRCGSDIMCIILCYIFIFSEVFFHSRVIGACPATTDCILLWRWVNVRTTATKQQQSMVLVLMY